MDSCLKGEYFRQLSQQKIKKKAWQHLQKKENPTGPTSDQNSTTKVESAYFNYLSSLI